MSFVKKCLLGALIVAIASVFYNYVAFTLLKIYPDFTSSVQFLQDLGLNFYLVIFLKNFLVGMVLMVLFAEAYNNMAKEAEGGNRYLVKGVFYYSLYAVFAFISFSLADIALIRSSEGFILLMTLDGMIETFIATIPIKFFLDK